MSWFFTAFSAAISLVSGFLTIRDAWISHPGTHRQRRRFGWIITICTLVLTIIFLVTSISSIPLSPASGSSSTTHADNASNQTTETRNQGSTPTTLPTSTPTPTPPGVGTVLYQADQSTGWNGWSGSGGWQVSSSGLLINDGSDNDPSTSPTIIAPYAPQTIADYAVEIQMQLVTTLDPTVMYGNFPVFDILVRGTSSDQGWQGYQAGFYYIYPPLNAWIKGAQDQSTLQHAPFDPGHVWHTYRIAVKGSDIRFSIDGGLKVDVTDLRYASGGQIGLKDFLLQAQIRSFEVIAL